VDAKAFPWLDDENKRSELLDAYARWAIAQGDDDKWAPPAIEAGIWRHAEPLPMLEPAIDVVNKIRANPRALEYVGAGPLESLLGGTHEVMERAVDEARHNEAFRVAISVVYGVRYNEPGYERLHDLSRAEISDIPRRQSMIRHQRL
jgi:hypothetical protein